MIIVGFVLLAAAAVIAVALIVQNPATVTVHAFTWSWDVDLRWLLVAGLALTAIGLVGLALMRGGGARYRRLRRERKVLAAENERLINRAGTEQRPPAAAEARAPMPTAPMERRPAAPPAAPPARPLAAPPGAAPAPSAPTPFTPARPAPAAAPAAQPPPAQPPAAQPPAAQPPPGAPAAPATGSVAAPERPEDTSTHRSGFRERLAASRHRHERE